MPSAAPPCGRGRTRPDERHEGRERHALACEFLRIRASLTTVSEGSLSFEKECRQSPVSLRGNTRRTCAYCCHTHPGGAGASMTTIRGAVRGALDAVRSAAAD